MKCVWNCCRVCSLGLTIDRKEMTSIEAIKVFFRVQPVSPHITMYAAFMNLGCPQSQAVLAFKNCEEFVSVDCQDGARILCTSMPEKGEASGWFVDAAAYGFLSPPTQIDVFGVKPNCRPRHVWLWYNNNKQPVVLFSLVSYLHVKLYGVD